MDQDKGSLQNLSLYVFDRRSGWRITLPCLIDLFLCLSVLMRVWFESESYSIAEAGLELNHSGG